MNKVIFEWRNVPDYSPNFSDKFEYSFDAMHFHLQPSLKCVKNILDSTVTRPIRGPKDNSMPTLGYQVQHWQMAMDIQIIHRQKEQSSGAIRIEPIEQIQ